MAELIGLYEKTRNKYVVFGSESEAQVPRMIFNGSYESAMHLVDQFKQNKKIEDQEMEYLYVFEFIDEIE